MKPNKITGIITMGDSLSDTGTMADRGFVMYRLSGLKAKSPRKRFTNGFNWADDTCASLANEFTIRQLEAQDAAPAHDEEIEALDLEGMPIHHRDIGVLDNADIGDEIIAAQGNIEDIVQHSYTLDNNLRVDYQGEPFARSYAEGGLTAHSWAGSFISSISRFFSRLILSTLSKKREQLLADDRASGISPEQKAKTLVVEWSGANDLITVNKRPTHAEADKAIEARIQNVRELKKNGYKHFVLFNLPDLGLTPRYKGTREEANARECSDYFNTKLAKACADLAIEFGADTNPGFSIEVFDVSTVFSRVYHDPQAYEFDPEKRSRPYTSSDAFRENRDHTSPAQGYMFWDDVHPTAHLHALLADEFYKKYKVEYKFQQPRAEAEENIELQLDEAMLLGQFRRAYQKKFNEEKQSAFGFFRRSRNKTYHTDNLETILEHALYNGGNRSLQVLQDLGWFDSKKNVIPNCRALENALEHARANRDGEVAPIVPI